MTDISDIPTDTIKCIEFLEQLLASQEEFCSMVLVTENLSCGKYEKYNK
jgi:hypothetical protein